MTTAVDHCSCPLVQNSDGKTYRPYRDQNCSVHGNHGQDSPGAIIERLQAQVEQLQKQIDPDAVAYHWLTQNNGLNGRVYIEIDGTHVSGDLDEVIGNALMEEE